MIKIEYPLSELTGKIIGCAMEVHRIMGEPAKNKGIPVKSRFYIPLKMKLE